MIRKATLPLAVLMTLSLPTAIFAQTALPSPADREGASVAVNGADIFYSESGEGDAIVLLHGFPLSGALFEKVRDKLDDTHRVVTIDHRGFGKSPTPAVVESVTTYAEDALAVMAKLDIKTAVIGGMSMGGPIAFEMYRQKPEVFSGLILIDSNAKPADPIEKGIWTGAGEVIETKGVAAIFPFLMGNMLTGATRAAKPEDVAYLTAVMEQASPEGAVGGTKVLASRPDSMATLTAVAVPILVLVGEEDPVYAVELAKEMVAAAKDATLAVIPGASHAAIFEKPDDSSKAILDWMAATN